MKRLHLSPLAFTILAVAAAVPSLHSAPPAPAKPGWPPSALQLLEQAGNTESERERRSALEKLAAVPALDEAARQEASAMAEFVRRWNESSLKFYGQDPQVKGKGARALGAYDFGVPEGSPLRPIAELYRGRMLAWMLIENSTVRTHPVESRWFKDEAIKSFRAAERAFPKNRIAGMYQGRAIPWPREYAAVAGAPEWAVLQREQLERLREIILWWIEHRQKPDGRFRRRLGRRLRDVALVGRRAARLRRSEDHRARSSSFPRRPCRARTSRAASIPKSATWSTPLRTRPTISFR